jgi:hypothetical protein
VRREEGDVFEGGGEETEARDSLEVKKGLREKRERKGERGREKEGKGEEKGEEKGDIEEDGKTRVGWEVSFWLKFCNQD